MQALSTQQPPPAAAQRRVRAARDERDGHEERIIELLHAAEHALRLDE
mgnify:CR=1 FL=1